MKKKQQAKNIDKRRRAKKTRREHDRKLVRKLSRITERVSQGGYDGVKESPLLALNIEKVRRWLSTQ